MDAKHLLTMGTLNLLLLCSLPAGADPTPLDAPWALTGAYVAPHGVQLTWNAPVASPVDHYRVYRTLNESSFSLYAEVTGTAYLDPDGGTGAYSYYVTSVTASVESSPSNEVYGWPSCRLVSVLPFDINTDPVHCLLPLPIVGTPFIYRIPIVGSVPA